MGTNYYWRTSLDRLDPITLPTGDVIELAEILDRCDPRIHIGKRSGAGRYCWACRQTLCPDGDTGVHQGIPIGKWHITCPTCGKRPVISTTPRAAGAGRPLSTLPTYTTACSFSWAQDPSKVRDICDRNPFAPIVVDEEDTEMECSDFLKMLKQTCPIEFTHSIGVPFS